MIVLLLGAWVLRVLGRGGGLNMVTFPIYEWVLFAMSLQATARQRPCRPSQESSITVRSRCVPEASKQPKAGIDNKLCGSMGTYRDVITR